MSGFPAHVRETIQKLGSSDKVDHIFVAWRPLLNRHKGTRTVGAMGEQGDCKLETRFLAEVQMPISQHILLVFVGHAPS